jgi:hypothetical protein
MDTKVLYYKKFEGNVKSHDYVDWAFSMLENGISSTSLNILASLKEPLNIFEIEDYFNRVLKELNLREPSHEESAKYYIQFLLREIIDDKSKAINYVI